MVRPVGFDLLRYSSFAFWSGNLMPLQVSQPSLLDEEDEPSRPRAPFPDTPLGKGKRKAPPE